MEKVLKQLVNVLGRRVSRDFNLNDGDQHGEVRVSGVIDPLEIGVIVAVILVVLYWVVWLPKHEKKKRERNRPRVGKGGAGAAQPWDPDLTRGRRNR